LHAWLNHRGYEGIPEQFTYGHEFSGEVVETGPGVEKWKTGDRAVAVSVQGCLKPDCPYCSIGYQQLCPSRQIIGIHLDGGMAEYVIVRQDYLVPVSNGTDMLAASLTEPLSVAEHCVTDCSDVEAGELVLVTGPGIIGLLCAIVARFKGAKVVVSGLESDNKLRLPAAEAIGFETLVTGEGRPGLLEQTRERYGQLFDRQIEASGSGEALAQGLEAVRPLGSSTVVGLFPELVQLNMTNLVRNQITIRTSYVSDFPNYERALDIIQKGEVPVSELVHTYSLEDGLQAFVDAEEKAVIKPVLIC
jgi:L-iditol 2-dehydrogenase